MTAKRHATVDWERDLAKGSGRVRFGSGALPEVGVSWASRTEEPAGKTSPEELLAAAHASCFSMALSAALARAGKPPEHLHVEATCTFDKVDSGWKVVKMEIRVQGKVPGFSAEEFGNFAKQAGESCPISQALRNNVPIQVEAHLA
jgi:osmotically inducible protein OsmC